MDNENIIENQTLTQPAEPIEPVKPAEKIPPYKAVIAWCTLGLGFVFTHFAFNYVGGIWGGVFWLLFGVLGAVYAVKTHAKITGMQVAMFVIAEVFCFTPLFCASRFINCLAAVFSFVLYFYLAIAVSGAEPFGKRFLLDAILAVFARPFERFAECVRCALSVFKGKRRAKNVLYAVIGLLIAVPLTMVVVTLLAFSDARFEDFILTVLDYLPDLSFAVFFEILFAVPIAMYLFGAFSSMEKQVEVRDFDSDKLRVFPTMITYFAVTPICLFYVAYIIIQVMNIASALDQTLDYAQFARDGFFELCAIAVINLGVIAVIQAFSKRTRVLKGYIVALGLLSLGVTATALVKMGMYISEYGMTLLRVYTTWFMLVMCVAFVLLIVLQFRDYKFWRALFFGFTAMFAVLCFGNFNGNIAAYNIAAYRSGAIEELDVYQFEELGVAAVSPAYKLYRDCDDKALAERLERFIDSEMEYDKGDSRAAYFSIPRAKAWSAFEKYDGVDSEVMRLVVNVDTDSAYRIGLEYLFDGKLIGGRDKQYKDGYSFTHGEQVEFTFLKRDFPDVDEINEKVFGVSFVVTDKNGKDIYPGIPVNWANSSESYDGTHYTLSTGELEDGTVTEPVWEWIAERGGEYEFVLRESNTDGFYIYPVH